jgi:hypothetical protein
LVFCRCFSFCHSRRESAVVVALAVAFVVAFAVAVAVAFLSVIPEGNLLLLLSLLLPLLFFLSFPKGICFCLCFIHYSLITIHSLTTNHSLPP